MKKYFLLAVASLFAPILYADQTPQATPTKSIDYANLGAVTGTFALTTDYIFRGLSQSSNLPAAQGALTYTFNTYGVYFSLWGSSVDSPDPIHNETATIELDTVAGIANDINDNASYDLSIVRYNYPKAPSSQYNEFIGLSTYKIFTLTLAYSPNVYNSSEGGTYVAGQINYDVPCAFIKLNDVTASIGAGHYSLPRNAGLNSYNDYLLGLSKKIKNYTLALQWSGTDAQKYYGSVAKNVLIATVTASF